jgi:SAM-dependent methyltransferase
VDEALRHQARIARSEIRSGVLRGEALLQRILAVPSSERDAWVDELLGLPEAPPDVPELPRGAVPYLPAGADEIIRMVLEAPLRPQDRLVDLGSGLGRVVLLAHLLSGARGCGVEIQEPLVRCARICCAELALTDVSFVHADATEAALGEPAGPGGLHRSVFFLYSPFSGEALRRVLRRLEGLARRRHIVVCTVGLELPDERWLLRRQTSVPAMTLYDARAPGTAEPPPAAALPHPALSDEARGPRTTKVLMSSAVISRRWRSLRRAPRIGSETAAPGP